MYNLNETDPLATLSSRSSNGGLYKQCKILVSIFILLTFMYFMKLFNVFCITSYFTTFVKCANVTHCKYTEFTKRVLNIILPLFWNITTGKLNENTYLIQLNFNFLQIFYALRFCAFTLLRFYALIMKQKVMRLHTAWLLNSFKKCNVS